MMGQILENWAFIALAAILSLATQIVKSTALRKEIAEKYIAAFYARKLLPMVPVLLGGLASQLPLPTPGDVAGGAERVLYFAFSGVSSTWIFSLIKGIAEKNGIKIEMPGDSMPPPVDASEATTQPIKPLSKRAKKGASAKGR